MISGQVSVHNLTDLQSCYDQQLANFGSIIKESIGINHQAVKLFTLIMPIWKHYICTSYGISKSAYGSEEDRYVSIGQGNKFSSNIC